MNNSPLLFQKDQTVLFQGDSITDCGRDKANGDDLGVGYAALAASLFSARHPELRIRFLNRGIGGDRVADLKKRWEQDCIALKPNWVSILVGINNTWRRFDSDDPTPLPEFERDYRFLLHEIKEKLGCGVILCEPFLLPAMPERACFREDLDPKIQSIRSLAREFDAIYIAFDGMFAEACAHREPAFWAVDCVHPGPAGHAMMASKWLKTVGAGG